MIKLTKTQKSNLEKLASFLENHVPPPRFNMSSFLENADLKIGSWHEKNSEYMTFTSSSKVYNHCGTVACAVGHGPLVGIHKKRTEGWFAYADRVFGSENMSVFTFLFGGCWEEVDNTPEGAAARIRFFLDNNCELPPEFHDDSDYENLERILPVYQKYLKKEEIV